MNLKNNSKANFMAILLNITREFQRNYDEFMTEKNLITFVMKNRINLFTLMVKNMPL